MNILVAVIGFYKHIKADIQTLELQNKGLKKAAERLMGDQKVFECEHGSCGYQVESPTLDKAAWREAIMDDPNLFAVQAHFDKAEKLLREAQKPYMGKPEARFCIW